MPLGACLFGGECSYMVPHKSLVPHRHRLVLHRKHPSPQNWPIVWREHFVEDIIYSLVSWTKTTDTVTNRDVDLSSSVVYHACMLDSFNIWERTNLDHMDNTLGLWCQKKGSTTYTSPPEHLLQLQTLHHRYQWYLPCHFFVSKIYKGIPNRLFQSTELTNSNLLSLEDTA